MNHHSLYQFPYLWTFRGGWTKNLGTPRAAGIYRVPESMLFASSLAQPLLGGVKPKVPNQDPAFCWRVGNLPALRDPRNVGLEVRSAGWDTGKLSCAPDLLEDMPISLDKSLNLSMP